MREHASPGRPREFDEDEVLIKIMNLFWEKGYESVSLNEIVAATGLKKGSLYAAFKDKRDMYLLALAHYEKSVVDPARAGLKGEGDPYKKLRGFVLAPLDAVDKADDLRGCFLCNASADQSAIDAPTGDMVRRGFEKIEDGLFSAVTALHPDRTPAQRRKTARGLLSLYSGLRVMVRSGVSTKDLRGSTLFALEKLLD